MEELAHAIATHGEHSEPLSSPGLLEPEEPAVLAEQECPCGSGKPFMQCHGVDDEDDNLELAIG